MKRRFREYMDDQALHKFGYDRLNEADSSIWSAKKFAEEKTLDEADCSRFLGDLRVANFKLSAAAAAVGASVSETELRKSPGHYFRTLSDSISQRQETLQGPQGLERRFIDACVVPTFKAREKAAEKIEKAQEHEKRLEVRRAKEAGERAAKRAEKAAKADPVEDHTARVEAEKARKAKKRAGAKALVAAAKAELEQHRAEMRARNEAAVGPKPPMEHELEKPRKSKAPKAPAAKACRVKVSVQPAGCVVVED